MAGGSDSAPLSITGCDTVLKVGNLICCKVTDTSVEHNIRIDPAKPLTLNRLARFIPSDWNKVKAMYEAGDLPSPWFAGDTMPLSN